MATPPPNRTPAKHKAPPKGVPASSQRFLDVAQVRDGVVVMRDGSYRAIILVNAINFALKSDDEQNAIIYSYQSFLNSFNFPIQILMQSRQLDLANYIKKLEDQLAESTNELIQIQITDYIEFIGRLIQIANIMDKKFYIVVPFRPPVTYQRGVFDKLFHPANRLEVKMSPQEFKAYRQELLERAKTIMGGLAGLGLRTALLGTQETIELLYATYNPEEATKERLTNVENITGSYIHPGPPKAGEQQPGASTTQAAAPAAPVAEQSPLAEVAPEATAPIAPAAQPQPAPPPIPEPVVTPEPVKPEAIAAPAPTPVEPTPTTPEPVIPIAEPTPSAPIEPAAKPAVLPTNDLSLPTSLPPVTGPIEGEPQPLGGAAPAAPKPEAVTPNQASPAPVAPTSAPAPAFGTPNLNPPAPLGTPSVPAPTPPQTPPAL